MNIRHAPSSAHCGGAVPALLFALMLMTFLLGAVPALAAERPNILWISSEDNGPHLGAYGDAYATTPNLDALAARGMIYLHAWSNAPVCAPARTTLISGMYPTSTGSEHMRSNTRLPEGMKFFPQYLREAGYYCANNSKEDYNLADPGRAWDESSGKAHYRNRPVGAPFFAVFNSNVTHESQIRARPHTPAHDPAGVRLPAYHPDTPEARGDWAQYYDKMTEMDAWAGKLLAELESAGLAEDTIVFYLGDHGIGLPRGKRSPMDSGLHVPLIVYVPEKFRSLAPEDYAPGARSERLVSFVDFAPTVLSLAGIKPPKYFQGAAFMGEFEAAPRDFLHGFRGRMDERYDMARSVTDGRYVYVRNYIPHRVYGQHVAYMFQTPTTIAWKRLYDEGKLNAAQRIFWELKPAEELYDLRSDPDEVVNLADSAAHAELLARMRSAQHEQCLRVRDVGFLPEAEIHRRAGAGAPYALGRDPARYPLEEILRMAEIATKPTHDEKDDEIEILRVGLSHADSAVRFWAARGLLIRGAPAVAGDKSASADALEKALDDPSPSVRIEAAEALGRHGSDAQQVRAADTLLAVADIRQNDFYDCVQALIAIDELDGLFRSHLETIRALPSQQKGKIPKRSDAYIQRLVEKILADLTIAGASKGVLDMRQDF